MVLCLKVAVQDIERKRKELRKQGLLNRDYALVKERGFAFIPVIVKDKKINRSLRKEIFVEKQIPKLPRAYDYKKQLEGILALYERAYAPHAFDVIGDICVLRIDERLRGKAKAIGKVFLAIPGVRSVYLRKGEYEGELRTQKLTWLAGKRSKETVHRENGISLKLDVEKVYFSIRLATERLRIAQLVKKGEKILVLFSGCSPYECVVGKLSPAQHIVGVELNKIAHRYAQENVARNKLADKVTLYQGDAWKVVPLLKSKQHVFDRIIMSLPHSAEQFLASAAQLAHQGTVIHLYQFGPWEDTAVMHKKYTELVQKYIPSVRITNIVACGHYSPSKYRICVDILVMRKGRTNTRKKRKLNH